MEHRRVSRTSMSHRDDVHTYLTNLIVERRQRVRHPVRVGIDGVDGAGKSTFADHLADRLRRTAPSVMRVSIDDFHNPRDVRYRQGRSSPVGFLEDSFDVDRLIEQVLVPSGPGGDREITSHAFDVERDRRIGSDPVRLPELAVVVLDGIFLHQSAIRPHLDVSVWLDVPFEVSVARMAVRDGSDPSPDAPGNRRYVVGQQLYMSRDRPSSKATVVIDNSEWARPAVMRGPDSEPDWHPRSRT